VEFASLYLMLLPQGWYVIVVFSNTFVEEIKILEGLELHPLPQLGWFEWKSLEFPKN
jgi:hypothetical protein